MRRHLEAISTVLVLFFMTGGLLTMTTRQEGLGVEDPTQSDPVKLVVQLTVYILVLAFALLKWRSCLSGIVRARWVFLLSLLAIASAAWSPDPWLSARRGIVLLFTTGFGAYFAVRYSPQEQRRLLACCCGLVILLSIIVAVALPTYGVSEGLHQGAWKGIFSHKNGLGRMMLLSIIVFALVEFRRKQRLLKWIFLSLAVIVLVLSQSSSALVLAIIITVILVLLPLLRLRGEVILPVWLVTGAVVAAGCSYAVVNADSFLQILGKDSSLSGRTMLWMVVSMAISQKPWLGHGFDAFWTGMQGASASVLSSVGWAAPNSHNGYLDLLVDLGVVGLLVYLVGYIGASWKAMKQYRRQSNEANMWPLMYLAFVFLVNMTESTILRQNSIFWALYVTTIVTVSLPRRAITEGAHMEYLHSISVGTSYAGINNSESSPEALEASRDTARGRKATPVLA